MQSAADDGIGVWFICHFKTRKNALMPLLSKDERVVLDFTGVNVVSNSIADECIAKLLMEMSLDELKSKTTFTGLNKIAEACVLTALQRRYAVISRQS